MQHFNLNCFPRYKCLILYYVVFCEFKQTCYLITMSRYWGDGRTGERGHVLSLSLGVWRELPVVW